MFKFSTIFRYRNRLTELGLLYKNMHSNLGYYEIITNTIVYRQFKVIRSQKVDSPLTQIRASININIYFAAFQKQSISEAFNLSGKLTISLRAEHQNNNLVVLRQQAGLNDCQT